MKTNLYHASRMPLDTDVLIVGAGPTGMALAIALQQAGISHLIIDKLPEGLNTSRAGVIHAHTLEALDQLGVARRLVDRGLTITDFRIRDRDRALLKLNFETAPSSHRYVLMIPQDVTEEILSERLTELGGTIYRGVSASAARQDASGATVTVTTPDGDVAVRAKYVVGADGMHSIVRSASGAEFEGETIPESFILADVKMEWCYRATEVSLFFSPEGMVVVAPLPNDRYRVVATVAQAPEKPAIADIQALIDQRGPKIVKSTVTEVIWSSRFRVHHRVASAYRNGRFLLMGDAAHVHSPAGGQGMNTGLVDAVVLGQLLARAIQTGDASVLDTYERLRRPAAKKVLALAGQLTGLATMRGAVRRSLRNSVLSLINAIPLARKRIVMNLSGLSRKSFAEIPGGVLPLPLPAKTLEKKGQLTI